MSPDLVRRALLVVLPALLCACGDSTAGLGPAGVKLSFVEAVPLQLGGQRTYTLKVERKGGVEGALDLRLEEQSLGFTFAPVQVPAEADAVPFTVSISDGPPPGPANVPVAVRTSGDTYHVSIPVQLVGVPDGVTPQLDLERKSVVAGEEVDVLVRVDRSNGFTMGFSVNPSDEPGLVQRVGSANFGYQTQQAVLRVQVDASVPPGAQTFPYVLTYGGAYGSAVHTVNGAFTLDVVERSVN